MLQDLTIKEVQQFVNNQEKNQELIDLLLADGRQGLKVLANKIKREIQERVFYEQLWNYEKKYWEKGLTVIGLDEVGRGPLAGPVVAAAVAFAKIPDLLGLKDSKKLGEQAKEDLADKIKEQGLFYNISVIDNNVIDQINILNASKLAMVNAVKGLGQAIDLLLIDGNFTIDYPAEQIPVVKGDEKVGSIAAAAIIAKVYRDNYMLALHKKYPMYNFAKNKGYPTEEHYWALKKYGPSPVHRITFKGVKEGLGGI
ncbi:ribonuclease HII [Anaerobranca gottschalkii]|uniref:Ribonuclease HII n=1 Tax=Anaerobranca gottschalkii DSM 13577 TaxID=1120990 RepID=A0A1I0BGM6_9FIRM|nr:ribonuclease HII [Anaerobranca gottschalkii]SET05666.1 RNase HII [Anaerobranca gottschalkii DSM 13577]